MKYEFQSRFSEDIKEMLKYRAALGRNIVGYQWNMANFDRFCISHYPDESTLTKELVLDWCNAADGSGSHRAGYARGFGKYLFSMEKNAFILPPSFFASKKADLPYILSDDEFRCFFKATDIFPGYFNSPLIEYTVPVIFRLMYACGLRPQEARLLKRVDFNFKDCTIYVAEAKHCKDRRLAVNSGIMDMCRNYDRIAETAVPGRIYFFPSPEGGHYKPGWLTAKFHKCWELSGIGTARGVCTPYDLRHNYATQTLMRWIEEGKDLNAWIPYLTTYMGHVTFSSTFYYIHLLPKRLGQMDFMRSSGIIPEVSDEKETL
jgi:integrase